MKISELTITHDEVVTAVREWLARQGFDVPVENVRRPYSWSDYTVDLKLPESEPPAPVDSTPITPAISK
jgi:hypothetical protein